MDKNCRELILVKDGEKYIFRFDRAADRRLVGVLGRFAADPQLSFSWYDAAVLCKKLRDETRMSSAKPHSRPANRCFDGS